MDIDTMTIGQAREIAGLFGGQQTPSLPFKVGEKWLIRCVTNYIVGEVVAVHGTFIEMGNASWVADTGRFSECLATGTMNEVECQKHRCLINSGAIVDAFEWRHPLPELTK